MVNHQKPPFQRICFDSLHLKQIQGLSTSFYYRAADLLSFNSGISACAQADFFVLKDKGAWKTAVAVHVHQLYP